MNSRKVLPADLFATSGQPISIPDVPGMTYEDYQRGENAQRTHTLAQIGATLVVLGPHFTSILESYTAQVFSAMAANGFWRGEQDNFGSKTALVHSELSEMLEANRKSIGADDKIPEFSGEEAEAADTIIRLLDMAGRYKWRLGEAITAKMLFNLTRPFKHGKGY